AGIVHEINTPVGAISSNNQVLVRSLELVANALNDPRPESLNKARDIVKTCASLAAVDKIACERIIALVRGVKTYSRTGSAELSRADLNERLRTALQLAHGEFRRRIVVWTDF